MAWSDHFEEVWDNLSLIKNKLTEGVLKTLDTDGIYYEVELSDLYDKDILSGWNWFSLNRTSEDMSINNVLASLSDNNITGDYIKYQEGFSDYYSGFGWFGAIEYMNNISTYKLYMSNEGQLVYSGDPVDLATSPINIGSGWNWFAYLPQDTLAINTAIVTTLTGTQTLTNKTLTTPVISSISNSGTVTLPSGVASASPLITASRLFSTLCAAMLAAELKSSPFLSSSQSVYGPPALCFR